MRERWKKKTDHTNSLKQHQSRQDIWRQRNKRSKEGVEREREREREREIWRWQVSLSQEWVCHQQVDWVHTTHVPQFPVPLDGGEGGRCMANWKRCQLLNHHPWTCIADLLKHLQQNILSCKKSAPNNFFKLYYLSANFTCATCGKDATPPTRPMCAPIMGYVRDGPSNTFAV